MPDEEYLAFEADGAIYNVTLAPKPSPTMDDDEYESYGLQEDLLLQMQKARQMIRTCTLQTIGALRDLKVADVEEINLKFGIKLGGKAGLPYITEGSAESNLEISVKCKFPQEKPLP